MSPQPISDRPQRKGCGRVGLALFGTIFFIAGCVALYFILLVPLMKWNDARNWESTECQITAAQIESHRSDDGTSYGAKFTYKYEVDGNEYSCDENSLFEVNGSHRSAKRKLKKHPVGSTTNCFYDPDDPSDALLNRELTWGMLFGLLPLIFIAVGGGIMSSAIFGWGWNKTERKAGRTKMIGVNRRDLDRSRDMQMGITTASNSSVRSSSNTYADSELPADEEDRKWDEPSET